MRLSALFPIRIHFWGGFGSQCFAWALALELADRFPGRNIVLVQHESGITKRFLEIPFLNENFGIRIIRDFKPLEKRNERNLKLESNISSLKLEFRNLARKLLSISGLVVSIDNDVEFQKIKPWVLSTRGHYSHRSIDEKVFGKMSSHSRSPFYRENSGNPLKAFIGVHWRLGDLLRLSDKEPVSKERLFGVLGKALSGISNCQKMVICSDSESLALAEIKRGFPTIDCEVFSGDSTEVIRQLISSEVFIGTNSKLSFWIALARDFVEPEKKTFLPKEIMHHFSNEHLEHSRIEFY